MLVFVLFLGNVDVVIYYVVLIFDLFLSFN